MQILSCCHERLRAGYSIHSLVACSVHPDASERMPVIRSIRSRVVIDTANHSYPAAGNYAEIPLRSG
jgi:hypothetical protein